MSTTENKVVTAAKANKTQAGEKVKKKGVSKGSTRLNAKPGEFNELAEAFKILRHVKNDTHENVAAALEMAHISYFDIEKRSKMPTLQNVMALGKYLGVSYTTILTFSENVGKLHKAGRLNADTALSLYAQTFGLEDISDIVQ